MVQHHVLTWFHYVTVFIRDNSRCSGLTWVIIHNNTLDTWLIIRSHTVNDMFDWYDFTWLFPKSWGTPRKHEKPCHLLVIEWPGFFTTASSCSPSFDKAWGQSGRNIMWEFQLSWHLWGCSSSSARLRHSTISSYNHADVDKIWDVHGFSTIWLFACFFFVWKCHVLSYSRMTVVLCLKITYRYTWNRQPVGQL